MALKLVVGLGNPGPEYEKTRHNVGFRLADRLAALSGGETVAFSNFKGLGVAAKSGDLWIAKPMTFMNLSGEFVWKFAAYHNIALEDILIAYDELALPLGKIRLRRNGSAGGQNGMKSIIAHFGTDNVSRIRIGIGPQPEKVNATNFVLGKFNKSEEIELEAVLDRAAEAVRFAAENGIDTAMNRYNPAA